MFTDEDIKKLKSHFATKDDISDIKDDISNIKKDISNLKKADQAILKGVFSNREELQRLEERFDKKFDRVLNLVDAVLGEVKAMREEQATHVQRHDDIERDIKEIQSVPIIAHQLKK